MNQEGRKANKGSIHKWVPVTGNWELGSVFSRTFRNVELVSGLSLWPAHTQAPPGRERQELSGGMETEGDLQSGPREYVCICYSKFG